MARVVPLMGQRHGDQSAEACRLVGQMLTTGHQGGFARDVAQQASSRRESNAELRKPPVMFLDHWLAWLLQVVDADGLDALATSLEASPQVMVRRSHCCIGNAKSHLDLTASITRVWQCKLRHDAACMVTGAQLGPTAEMLDRIASAGSHLCNAVIASSAVFTLAEVSSAALISGDCTHLCAHNSSSEELEWCTA